MKLINKKGRLQGGPMNQLYCQQYTHFNRSSMEKQTDHIFFISMGRRVQSKPCDRNRRLKYHG